MCHVIETVCTLPIWQKEGHCSSSVILGICSSHRGRNCNPTEQKMTSKSEREREREKSKDIYIYTYTFVRGVGRDCSTIQRVVDRPPRHPFYCGSETSLVRCRNGQR